MTIARLILALALAATVCACHDGAKGNGGEPASTGGEAHAQTRKPDPQPPSGGSARRKPDPEAELQEIADKIASNPNYGIFVATNREILNRAEKSFSDQLGPGLTYGIAYQPVLAVDGGVKPKPYARDFQFAKPDLFFDYISKRQAEAQRYPKHIVVFVHGFRQKPGQAMSTAIAIKSLLRFDGPFVLFMWPSVGAVENYGTDRLKAEVSDEALSQLLCQLAAKNPGAKITILAHSMGSYLTINTLQDFSQDCPAKPKLNALVMFSPDLPVSLAEPRAPRAVANVGSATAYVSEYDLAVRTSKKVWQDPNLGIVLNKTPSVVPGIASVNVSTLQLDAFDLRSLNHDSYAYTQVMDDVHHLLRDGQTDPVIRSIATSRMTRPDNRRIYYVMDGARKGR
ncbi:hypothetical protein DMC18_19270 [Caulobacter sp. D5]|uniref:alpha/beta hydrolase n=1 Tax=Caulobacter sp. D5 TaxID=357400 RepID=UPI000D73C5E4|nr:alpha/beta hydrolase [Caulobacter sp. D5]PXA88427.1 hypothetical protein DMC18_19270 [Caulobacter sp. D5]